MMDWKDVEWNTQRHEQLLQESLQREIREQALLNQGEESTPKQGRIQRIYGPALVRLGSLLMDWGTKLQDRYSNVARQNADENLTRELERILAQNARS